MGQFSDLASDGVAQSSDFFEELLDSLFLSDDLLSEDLEALSFSSLACFLYCSDR